MLKKLFYNNELPQNIMQESLHLNYRYLSNVVCEMLSEMSTENPNIQHKIASKFWLLVLATKKVHHLFNLFFLVPGWPIIWSRRYIYSTCALKIKQRTFFLTVQWKHNRDNLGFIVIHLYLIN